MFGMKIARRIITTVVHVQALSQRFTLGAYVFFVSVFFIAFWYTFLLQRYQGRFVWAFYLRILTPYEHQGNCRSSRQTKRTFTFLEHCSFHFRCLCDSQQMNLIAKIVESNGMTNKTNTPYGTHSESGLENCMRWIINSFERKWLCHLFRISIAMTM